MKIIEQLELFIKFYLYMHFNSERFPCTFILFLLFMPSRSREIQTCVGLKKTQKLAYDMSQAHHLRDDTLISAGESHSLILHYLVNNKRLLLIKNFLQTLCI